MKLICFGDSNTYGYDPRPGMGGRYGADSRWVEILAAKTGWTVSNMGRNGREIPVTVPDVPEDADMMIVMLGTNDLLQGRSPQKAAERLKHFLLALPFSREQILMIAPPPMEPGDWVRSRRLIDDSKNFAQCCRTLAGQLGIPFADSADWNISLARDGVHFTPQGHRAFAAGILEVLK